ncbi:MAG: hypothetical protein DRJ61_07860 [Acidobacteria bacterium]|nr:MAG: hypothetical protein DRJ61_07860 [Acidobacteriota bacterium]
MMRSRPPGQPPYKAQRTNEGERGSRGEGEITRSGCSAQFSPFSGFSLPAKRIRFFRIRYYVSVITTSISVLALLLALFLVAQLRRTLSRLVGG